jgi:glycosyltransferase involved in cell wall biosynthesis
MHGPNILSALIKIVNPWLLVKVSERSGFRQLIFRDFLRMFLYLFVDSVLFNSYKSKDFITNKFYWLRKKSNIIYNVIDGQLFSFFDNRDFSKHSICVVANYRPEKNVDLLIDFLHTYVSKRETCFITWYGNNFYVNGRPSPSSKCYQTAIGKIRSLELSKNLKLYPLVEKPVEVYRKNNALLLLSSFEGFPNVVGEAMMSGCVILVSPVSDVDLIIEHRKTGFIFRDFTIEALEEGFEWYFSLTSEDLIIAGELNRLKAEKLFTTENINRLL